MGRLLFSLYAVCYFCYIFYTRVPDYFDGETAYGKIEKVNNEVKVNYIVNAIPYSITSKNYFNYFKQNERIEVIYHHSKPNEAAIYHFFTYWFNAKEFLLSLLFLLGSYFVAVALNNNAFEPPPPSAYKERKYD
jgi:hypothetical protein